MKDYTETTMPFNSEQLKQENIRNILELTNEALSQRGYDSIRQIAGYLVSNDPAYISSHKGARSIIQSVDQYDIIEELVRFYMENK